jgi:putative N6-adenine-specific DNA methylase
VPPSRNNVFVSCSAGLEPALAEELTALGFKGRSVTGGFETTGDPRRIELHSRIASRVNDGRELYRRGYREEIGRAPLRETLAAGVLRLAGYDGTEPLWDPMCGSGTVLIEAALIATGTPPGDLKAHGRAAAALLKGSDLNAGALGVTRRNARRAGLTLELVRADAAEIEPPPGPKGLLVANLPYGKRVEKGDLTPVLENFATRFSGWRFALLTQGRLPVLTSLQQHELSNGGLRCRLYVGVC